ncbi:hypothetical protein [Orrella sp. 11846]|uniref:hypothetical protein n=1 Tax=Orrella sp. 11846 TaxID=3409913 RepID=UPI003B5A91AE
MLFHRISRLFRALLPSLFIAAALSVIALPAQAQRGELIDSVTGEQVFRMMKKEGYAVVLSDDDDEVIKWKIDGTTR